jgi:hypothetical protein
MKNIRKKRESEYHRKIELHYKKENEKKINELIEDHAREIDLLLQQHNKIIENNNNWHEDQLSNIRSQERKRFDNVMQELRKKIEDQEIFIKKHKQQYEDIEEREIIIDDTIRKINTKFERGLKQIAEGFQVMQFAQNDIEDYRRKYIKSTKKIPEAIKE